MINLNKSFLNRMQTILGNGYDAFIKSLDEHEEKAIFVNNNKISANKLLSVANFNLEKIEYEPNGYYIGKQKLGKHPLHHAGAFYVQDPNAMFTVNAFNFNGNERVLDMCASPGGKSIQIANRIKEGVLVSNEIVKSRCEVLFSNIERMGLKNVIITNDTPANISKAYANMFDVCLVDAPCSGEGMFRRGEEYINSWNENLPAMCAVRQLEILEEANKCLKEGGHLIYSTCTYSKEENEDVVNKFMLKHSYKLINIQYPHSRGMDMPEAVRLYPHESRGEGQFVAVLKKLEENNLNSTPTIKLQQSKTATEFIKTFTKNNFNAYVYDRYAYHVADANFVRRGVKLFSIGVRLGESDNKIFKPCHYLFSAFGRDFLKTFNISHNSSDATKYLHGDTLNLSQPDGYGAVLIDNCPVGGYKISAQKFKNLYPKGLRNL